jgi:predicted TIM-barrel fold metal-dependent hydrolase
MIIDTEVHPLIVAHPSQTNPDWSMVKHFTWHEHPPELLIAEMDQAAVDGAFLISYDAEDILWSLMTKGLSLEDFAGGAKYCKQGLDKFPNRFWWFNTVKNPQHHDAARLVHQDLANGAIGIKLFPGYINSHLTGEGLIAVFEEVARANARALVSFQTLRPPHTLGLEDYLAEMDEILTRFPQTNFALMQGGCADPLSESVKPVIALARKHGNVFLSTGNIGEIWDDDTEYPFPNYLRRIEVLVREVGAERLMWGTDWPWFEDKFKYKQAVDSIRRHAHFMSEQEKKLFLGDTAAKFLGLSL